MATNLLPGDWCSPAQVQDQLGSVQNQQKTGVTPPGRLWYSDSTLGDTWQQKETRLPRQTEVHSKYIKGLVTVKHKKDFPRRTRGSTGLSPKPAETGVSPPGRLLVLKQYFGRHLAAERDETPQAD